MEKIFKWEFNNTRNDKSELALKNKLDTEKKFKNQIEYADKIFAKYSLIIGEDEVNCQQITVKNMATGDQKKMSLRDTIKLLKTEQ